jgi:molecular chaperone IbpA
MNMYGRNSKNLFDMKDFETTIGQFADGFDNIFKTLDQMVVASQKNLAYPPFNIVKADENKYIIELAVAGFGTQDIEVEMKDGALTITGSTKSDERYSPLQYLHKGIAARAFKRTFALADSVEIKDAEMLNGMLRIFLENLLPLSKPSRKIEIKSKE